MFISLLLYNVCEKTVAIISTGIIKVSLRRMAASVLHHSLTLCIISLYSQTITCTFQLRCRFACRGPSHVHRHSVDSLQSIHTGIQYKFWLDYQLKISSNPHLSIELICNSHDRYSFRPNHFLTVFTSFRMCMFPYCKRDSIYIEFLFQNLCRLMHWHWILILFVRGIRAPILLIPVGDRCYIEGNPCIIVRGDSYRYIIYIQG